MPSDALKNAASEVGKSVGQVTSAYSGAAIQTVKSGEKIESAARTWQQSLGQTVSAIGIAASSIVGITAGIKQIKEGGTSNVLGGLGSIFMGAGMGIGGFSRLFPMQAAAPRAMGGPVGVNTPYLIGERGPELFVPFQSGRVISNNDLGAAVEALSGMQMPIYEDADSSFATAPFMGDNNRNGSSATAPFMGDNNRNGFFATAPFMGDSDNQSALSVPFKRSSAGSSAEGSFGGESVIRFETTTINGMEFVTKDEAEKIGRTAAARGADLAQRRIKNSPQVRRSIGVMN